VLPRLTKARCRFLDLKALLHRRVRCRSAMLPPLAARYSLGLVFRHEPQNSPPRRSAWPGVPKRRRFAAGPRRDRHARRSAWSARSRGTYAFQESVGLRSPRRESAGRLRQESRGTPPSTNGASARRQATPGCRPVSPEDARFPTGRTYSEEPANRPLALPKDRSRTPTAGPKTSCQPPTFAHPEG
jgi:hypothetical protein